DVVGLAVQGPPQGGEDLGVVVDDEDRVPVVEAPQGRLGSLRRDHGYLLTASVRPLCPSSGRRTVNSVPCPGTDWISIRPRCAMTILYATCSPRPMPAPTSFVVKNGSNSLLRFSGAMPRPVSRILTITSPPSLRVESRTWPRFSMAWPALTKRLMKT